MRRAFALALALALAPAAALGAGYATRVAEGTVVPPLDPKAKRQPPMRTTLLVDEALARGRRASLALLDVSPKQRVAQHRHPGSAELLYVLEGKGRILAPGMEPGTLEPGVAVWIKPGAAHAFDVQSPQKPLRVLQVFAPLGPERVFRDRSKSAGFVVEKGKAEEDKAAFVLVKPDKVAPVPVPGGKGKATLLLDPSDLAGKQAYLGILELEAGALVPEHKHDGAAELLYVVEGTGEITIGKETVKLEPETAVHVPEGLAHAGKASRPMKLVQIYAPGGPEQRFKTQAKR